MELVPVQRAHSCKYNKSHALKKGDRRLTVFTDGDPGNYCLGCAKAFLEKDIERLQGLLREVTSHLTAR